MGKATAEALPAESVRLKLIQAIQKKAQSLQYQPF
ncbi:hypothetical protein J2S74_004066 [Evansella vedderi]|uniref:Uncharacterized protein n=1 Tax=Evansella vedderi TaxID=38282 RepID=A0ABU0A0J7_9BACI|nr:hypothetical protein [Evansella vedderi]